jgi:hypothetical protein
MQGHTKYEPLLRRMRSRTLSDVTANATLQLQSRCFMLIGSGWTHMTKGTGPSDGPLNSLSTTNCLAASPGSQIRAWGAAQVGFRIRSYSDTSSVTELQDHEWKMLVISARKPSVNHSIRSPLQSTSGCSGIRSAFPRTARMPWLLQRRRQVDHLARSAALADARQIAPEIGPVLLWQELAA